jgi:predicted nucleic acid-binding protein
LLDRDADSFVIDANAAVNAALVADAFIGWPAGIRLVAPTLLWSEAASSVSQLRWRGEISDEQAAATIARLLAAPIRPVPSQDVIADAVLFARQLGWAKSYDAEYVVLARRLGIPLLTVDARLAASVRHHVEVRSPSQVRAR